MVYAQLQPLTMQFLTVPRTPREPMDCSVRQQTEEINQEENEQKILTEKPRFIQHMHIETPKLMCMEGVLRVSGLIRDLVSRLVDHFREKRVTAQAR